MLQSKYLGIHIRDIGMPGYVTKSFVSMYPAARSSLSQSMSGCWPEVGQWTRRAHAASLWIPYTVHFSPRGWVWSEIVLGQSLIRSRCDRGDDWTGTGCLSEPGPSLGWQIARPASKNDQPAAWWRSWQLLDTSSADDSWMAACSCSMDPGLCSELATHNHCIVSRHQPGRVRVTAEAVSLPSLCSASNSLAPSQSHPFQLGTSTLNFRTIILSDPNISFDFCILNIQTRDIRPWECSDYTSWTSHSNTRPRIWKEQQARWRLFLSFYK